MMVTEVEHPAYHPKKMEGISTWLAYMLTPLLRETDGLDNLVENAKNGDTEALDAQLTELKAKNEDLLAGIEVEVLRDWLITKSNKQEVVETE